MSAVTYAFLPEQNPAASALPESSVLPDGYVGTGEDEHLLGLFNDLAESGISRLEIPSAVLIPAPMHSTQANFYAQSERVAQLLESAGRGESARRLRQSGPWWDFTEHLPLEANDAAGNYLLRVMLRFDEEFEAMVPSLASIFDLEFQREAVEFVSIERLQQFNRLVTDSIGEDGLIMSVERAWHVSRGWEYSEVRKLLASDMDLEYGLKLAEVGAESFEEAQHVSKTMPKHWIETLTKGTD